MNILGSKPFVALAYPSWNMKGPYHRHVWEFDTEEEAIDWVETYPDGEVRRRDTWDQTYIVGMENRNDVRYQ